MGTVALRGRVVSGRGEGAAFTQLAWVRAQFVGRLGVDPYPGTLNLWLDEPAELEKWRRVRENAGIVIEPASPDFCQAKGFPATAAPAARPSATLDGAQRVAVLLPDVPAYPEAQVELIAPVSLREALGVRDGDIVTVQLPTE